MCGVLLVIVAVAGLGLIDSGLPGSGATDDEVIAYFEDSGTELKREVGANLVAAGAFLLLVFVGSLRGTLARAESAHGTFSSISFGGGMTMATLLLVSALLEAGVASAEGLFDGYDVDADTAILLTSMSWWISGFILLAGVSWSE